MNILSVIHSMFARCLKAWKQRGCSLEKCLNGRSLSTTARAVGLDRLNIHATAPVFHNLPYPRILRHEVANDEGRITRCGAFAIDTGKFTGRSPKDKYIVKRLPSSNDVWWGDVNKPCTPDVFNVLYKNVTGHLSNAADKLYVFDGFCGTNPASRKQVRVVTELAWQHHFVTNMFVRPQAGDHMSSVPDFTILNGCKTSNPDYKEHGLNSECFVAFDIERACAVIGGTWYGGEMKKGMFSMMNYWLPLDGIMTMHCSANVGKKGDTALFFGLSGTGKTTLSADPERELIGDDEHGWDDDGVFNLEGGCYAKTIDLDPVKEPDIHAAIKQDALLENVLIDAVTGDPVYTDRSKTENGRVSYPIYHIDNAQAQSKGGHPKTIIFLTCDAYGILPPISKLSRGQAMYQFISGYTAKVAGTERGVTEPSPTFSACFGAAFLPLHPTVYADLLAEKLETHGTQVYMINTGWTGGAYGVGERMSLEHTRACVRAALNGEFDDNEASFTKEPVFGFQVPTSLPGVPESLLDARGSWDDPAAYDDQARKLAALFRANYKQFRDPTKTDYEMYGPILPTLGR